MLEGRVIRIFDRRTVVLNLGAEAGVTRGMRFAIYSPRTQIIDPETNEHLGTYRRSKAIVVAKTVAPRFTIASPAPRFVRSGGASALSALTGSVEEVDVDLNVSPHDVDPIPSGDSVAVGDTVEELAVPTPSSPASPSAGRAAPAADAPILSTPDNPRSEEP